MRSIQKQGTGGFHLNKAHQTPPQTPQEATSRWSSFRSHKEDLLRALLDEQYHLCCYSELRADQEGLAHHIEHVENKRQNPGRTFDYANLAASALDSANDLSVFAASNYQTFGGHAAGKNGSQGPVNMVRFVSPHQPDCRRFFAYLSDGRIVAAADLDGHEKNQAEYTIETLNLNSPFLVTRRRQWWSELDKLYQQHQDDGWSLEHLAAVDLVPTSGKLNRFFSLTRQFFSDIAEQTIQTQAPSLA